MIVNQQSRMVWALSNIMKVMNIDAVLFHKWTFLIMVIVITNSKLDEFGCG